MSHDSEAMALHVSIYVAWFVLYCLLDVCYLNLQLCRDIVIFVPSWVFEAFEKTALSAAIHKDHDGEVEHDDDCAHEGYHGYDDHDADGHDSDNDDDDDDDNDG